MIHEKGLCKVLSAAYKGGGYSVIPVRRQVETVARSWRRNEIILNGATWAVRCLTEDLPKEAAVQIVKDVGYMPMASRRTSRIRPCWKMWPTYGRASLKSYGTDRPSW